MAFDVRHRKHHAGFARGCIALTEAERRVNVKLRIAYSIVVCLQLVVRPTARVHVIIRILHEFSYLRMFSENASTEVMAVDAVCLVISFLRELLV